MRYVQHVMMGLMICLMVCGCSGGGGNLELPQSETDEASNQVTMDKQQEVSKMKPPPPMPGN